MFELQKGRKTCSPESNMRSEVNFQISPDIFLAHVAKIHYRTSSSGDIQHGLLSSRVVVYGVPSRCHVSNGHDSLVWDALEQDGPD